MSEIAVIGKGCRVYLTKGEFAVVDSEDFEYLNRWKWHFSAKGYACRKPGKQTIFMHRLINQTPDGLQTDHINHNKLDNRKENLRSVTNQENHFNRPVDSNNTSGYKGVSWDKSRSKWVASITKDDRNIHLGRFGNILDAVRARKDGEKIYHV